MITTVFFLENAVKLIKRGVSPENPVFFVFSDGMDWCKENFGGLDGDFVFVEENDNDNGPADMFLISRCAHFILSRSTFSYWGAFLSDRSPKKTVVVPVSRAEFDASGHSLPGKKKSQWIALPVE
jgi:hypothetical protein